MRGVGRLIRAVALLASGAFTLHQVRFVLGYGSHASEALKLQGHSYFPLVEALIAVLLASALIFFLRALIGARRGRRMEAPWPSFGRLWTFSAGALVAVYTLQEGFEGEFSARHPSGLAGVYGHGGWTSIPLAIAIGALVALLLKGAQCAIELSRERIPSPRLRPHRSEWPSLPDRFPEPGALSRKLAPRGPPLTS
jgi:hypothetical protein